MNFFYQYLSKYAYFCQYSSSNKNCCNTFLGPDNCCEHSLIRINFNDVNSSHFLPLKRPIYLFFFLIHFVQQPLFPPPFLPSLSVWSTNLWWWTHLPSRSSHYSSSRSSMTRTSWTMTIMTMAFVDRLETRWRGIEA